MKATQKAESVQKTVKLASIGANQELDTTQTRVKLNATTVQEYAEQARNGAKFPPITLFYDGNVYWVADGFHRLAFHKLLELEEIDSIVYKGGYKDAVLFGLKANNQHGLRPTHADKRAMVLKVLQEDETFHLSGRQIAEICGVSHTFVQNLEEELREREIRLQIGKEGEEGEEEMNEDGEVILKDSVGNVVPEHLKELFTIRDVIGGHVKAFAGELKQINGLVKDCAAKHDPEFVKLHEMLSSAAKLLRNGVAALKGVKPYALTNKTGEPVEIYLTEDEYNEKPPKVQEEKKAKRTKKTKDEEESQTVKTARKMKKGEVEEILSQDDEEPVVIEEPVTVDSSQDDDELQTVFLGDDDDDDDDFNLPF